jgi:hypothetical protein
MHIKDATSFKGQSDAFSKFGLQIDDQCTFTVSARRFSEEDITDRPMPRAGDVIWLQLKQRSDNGSPQRRYLFEIKFVEDKEQLFQLGYLYTYELRCELMPYTHESITTGITAVDDDDDVIVDLDGATNAHVYVYAVTFTNFRYSGNTAPTVAGFIVGERLYQGPANAPVASGVVASNANPWLLKDNIGTWSVSEPVYSLDSVRIADIVTVDDAPETHDPIADNDRTDTEPNVFVIRGSNPKVH